MILAKKTKAFIFTFILLISTFSFLISQPAEAQEPQSDLISELFAMLDTENIDFDNILTQNPYRFTSVWESNDTRTIKGDIDFSLYFSSILASQLNFLNYQDQIKVSLHKLEPESKNPVTIGETEFIKLTPEFLGEKIQNKKIVLKDVNVTIDSGDYLLFGVEINQTEKIISKRSEDKFENRFIPILRRISSYLKTREENESKEAALLIDMILENISALNIGGEELSSIINVFRSASFYYGSNSYPSNVKFSSVENESFTLYFRNEAYPGFDETYGNKMFTIYETGGYFKKINETKPVNETTDHNWPAITLENVVEIFKETISGEGTSEELLDEDVLNWAILWALYTLEAPPPQPENLVELYLEKDNILINKKPNGSTIREKIPKDQSLNFTGPEITRNRILENLSAELYIHYPKLITLGNLQIKASIVDLNDDKKEIANEIKSIDSATIFEIISRGPDVPTVFNFNDFDGGYEIEYDHMIGLDITIEKAGIFNLRPINLVYGSDFYESNIKYVYNETDNIKIQEFDNKNTYANGSAVFDLNIESKKEDTISIKFKNETKVGSWEIKSVPSTFEAEEGSITTIKVYVNSTAEDASAYNNKDKITSLITAEGKTGIDDETIRVRVKKEEVPFDFEVETPEEIEVKHGEEKTFKIKIKNENKGFVVDEYAIQVSSENDFYNYIKNIEAPIYNDNEENVRELELTISIPKYTEISTDNIIINITSLESKNVGSELSKIITIKTKIITPNILENIYHFFEQLSEKIGINPSWGAWFLIGLVALVILVIVITTIILLSRKFIELICLERIKEIDIGEKAEFEIEIINPYKEPLTYKITTESSEKIKERWDISLNQNQFVLAPGQKEIIKLMVSPTDYVKKDDWAEVKVVVKNIDKDKLSSIETATVLKEGKIDVSISNVLHWPKRFKKDDRVETSFKLYNRGSVSAEKLTIVLFVNGEEKSKVEDIIIPRGGYADVEMPWIAEKGKNEIKIIVK